MSARPTADPPREQRPDSGIAERRKGVAVLLVDDKPQNLLALEALLTPLGHELVSVGSGEAALAVLRDQDFALVLLDMRMPGLDGLQTASAMRRVPRARHTPVIFLTANDSREDIAQAYEQGAVDFLSKPINPDVLKAKVTVFAELFEHRQRVDEHELERRLQKQREQDLRAQNERLVLDAEVGAALGAESTLASALNAVASSLVRHLGVACAKIWIASDRPGVLTLQASAGTGTMADVEADDVTEGRGTIGVVAAERRAHVRSDAPFAGLPIVVADRLVGVVAVASGERLPASTLTSMQAISALTGHAIERRRAEEAVRASQAWLSTTLTSIGDGVLATDARGLVSFLNPVAEALTGWSSADARGKHLDEVFRIVSEEDRRPQESPVAKVMRERTVVAVAEASVLLRRDGGEVPIEDSAAPILNETGALTGVVLVFRDAGEKRRRDQERAELLARAKDSQRRAEIDRETAEAANRTKEEFLATASHELRTPLNAILGWAQMLRSGQLDASGFLRAAEIIERNAKAQVQLIEDILDGSRMITGKLHLEVKPLDLVTLVHAALDAVRPAAAAKKITLSAELAADAAQVVGDPDRLQQVVWNLANNAIKFTPKGGSVRVRLERSGTSIHLVVEDTGRGISPDFIPHVFERFRQAEGETTRRHGGLGLGLALVSHIVEAHGGSVAAASDGEGKGATFTVVLPVPAVHAAPISASEADALVQSRLATGDRRLEGVTVVVVDDEADSRDLVATVLRSDGAHVVVAPNAEAALAMVIEHQPHLLISDVGMPETDGYELMRRVRTRAGAAGATLPSIALTAYSREQDKRRAFEAGFHSHVAKPVEPAELLRVVVALLASAPSPAR